MTPVRRQNTGLRLSPELRMGMRLRMSLAQERAQMLQRIRNLRLRRKQMNPANQLTHRRPLPGSSALSSGEKE